MVENKLYGSIEEFVLKIVYLLTIIISVDKNGIIFCQLFEGKNLLNIIQGVIYTRINCIRPIRETFL